MYVDCFLFFERRGELFFLFVVKKTTKNTFHSSVLIVYIRGFGRAPLVANSHTQKGQERLHPIEGKKKKKQQKLITNTSLVNNKTYVRLKEQTQENGDPEFGFVCFCHALRPFRLPLEES